MTRRYSISEVLVQANETFLDSVSIDCVVLAFYQGTIKILLNRFKASNKWMLPGGFVYLDEDVDDAANRILKTRVGLDNVYLNQFHLFGKYGRTQKEENLEMLESCGIKIENPNWYLKRFISMGYYALVEYDKATIVLTEAIEDVSWHDLYNLPPLYADHKFIVEKAIRTMRMQIGVIPVAYKLLPEKFTMAELRAIYESILGQELDRRNFQRKMLSVGLISKLDEKRKNGSHKSPFLYSFNKEKYEDAEGNEMPLITWSS